MRHIDAWAIGLVSGATVALCVGLSEDVPDRIARWRRGYEGEQKTGKQLAVFRGRACAVLHDLADRRTERFTRANVDHVLVAPWGVFMLDSKAYRGSLTVTGDSVVVRDPDSGDEYRIDIGGGMRARAQRLQQDLRRTGLSVRIEPVVVLWSRFDVTAATSNGVHYVHGPDLAVWIETRRRVAPITTDVELVAARIRAVRSPN